jgi:hypothetical protein
MALALYTARMDTSNGDFPKDHEPVNPADLNAVSRDRIRRSQELMAELDRQLAASREARAYADELEEKRRALDTVRIKRPRR